MKISAKDKAIRVIPDIRDLIRNFAPCSNDPRLLRWKSALDHEDGSGIRVALLDSGIMWTHPALKNARIQVRDFTGSVGVFDSTGHGTKSAALLVSQGHGLLGLAPACTLLVAKVLGTGELEDSSKILARAICDKPAFLR